MKERSIPRIAIETAITEPDVQMPGSRPNTTRVHKNLPDGRKLQVVFKETKTVVRIITACWRD